MKRRNLKARSTAALVLAVHGRIECAEPVSRVVSPSEPSVPREAPPRLAFAVLQWTALLAAIAAPWVLLLTS